MMPPSPGRDIHPPLAGQNTHLAETFNAGLLRQYSLDRDISPFFNLVNVTTGEQRRKLLTKEYLHCWCMNVIRHLFGQIRRFNIPISIEEEEREVVSL